MADDIEKQAGHNFGMDVATVLKKATRPVTLKFDEVVYKIKSKRTKSCLKNSKKHEEKLILKNISGIVRPGEMLAMLGPSGSGKTTLLTALGGRLTGCLEGTITYNGQPFSNAMKRNTGFVTQHDVLYPHLTVTETLVFTALLRLPNTFSKEEKVNHAEAIIVQLGLTNCKNGIVGDSFVKGVSGGEKKRVSIGQEMLINPSLLLLDEPTSGLDSTTAQRIVSTLWELANGGRTIVMTIHQPSSRLFYMFHKVLLLSEGNPIYFGEGARVMDYFSSLGFAPSVAMNPSDFLLDLANGIVEDGQCECQAEVKKNLVSAYKTHLADPLKAELEETDFEQDYRGDRSDDKHFGRWATTWGQQFRVLFKRGLKERKHQSFSGLRVVQVLVVALIVGLLWWQADNANLQDKIGLLFFYSSFWSFYPLFQAIFTFPKERVMLNKERSSGTYRLSSYFMSRTMVDLPMELSLPTMFVTITYWMVGLKPSPWCFFHTLVVLLSNVLVAQGLGLALGALIMDQKSAAILGSVMMLSFQLSGGYFIQHVPPFIGWIKHLSFNYYTYKLLMGSQYSPKDTYPCGSAGESCLTGDFPSINKVGLDMQGGAVFALGLMLVGYRVVAYMALSRIGVIKR